MNVKNDAWTHGNITDEGLAEIRSRIGKEYPAAGWITVASRDAIWHMTEAIGDDNPLWVDEAYARKTRWGGIVAPPQLLYAGHSGPAWREKDHLGLPGVLGLWAGDRWVWEKPVRLGDPIKGISRMVTVEEKRSQYAGRSVEQVTETVYKDPAGEVVARYQQVVRRFERAAARGGGKYADMTPYVYSDAEMRVIEEQYAREASLRRGATPRYWEDAQIGESINTLVKGPVTITLLVGWLLGWGSPLCKTNRILFKHYRLYPPDKLVDPDTNVPDTLEGPHWNDKLAQLSGLPRGYDFGSMRCSWMVHALTDWMGDDGFLRRIDAKFTRPNLMGDTAWVTGRVVGKRRDDAGRPVVDCEVTCTNQRRQVIATAAAVVELPSKPAGR